MAWRFLAKHIEGRAAQVAGAQGVGQGLFVDQAAGTTLKNGTPYGPVPAPAVLPPPPVAPNAAPVFSGTTYSSGSNTYTYYLAMSSSENLTTEANKTYNFDLSLNKAGLTLKGITIAAWDTDEIEGDAGMDIGN